MKSIILAAGRGSRLQELTNEKPKSMVEFCGNTIINHIIQTHKTVNIKNIHVVTGYCAEKLKEHLGEEEATFHHNTLWAETNMVYSLFCALSSIENNDDIIISYSDILYTPQVLSKLIDSKHDLSIVVDKKWESLWTKRMSSPLNDAESLRLNLDNSIKRIGDKVSSYSEIEGQYIGLLKISSKIIQKIKTHYQKLEDTHSKNKEVLRNMYMTDFIQSIIDELCPAQAVFIEGGWLEIDTLQDLKAYKNFKHSWKPLEYLNALEADV